MKRQATPEQKAAAEERRARIKAICQKIAAMPKETREEIGLRLGIRTTEGRSLSYYNQILLHHQREAVSIVGGFRQWREQGRKVKKGARALAIWIPTGAKEAPTATAGDEAPEDVQGPRFICGNVFDISDTEELGTGALDNEHTAA